MQWKIYYMKHFTITEASDLLGVSRVTIWRWVKDGKIKSVQNGGGRKEFEIPESEIPPEKLKRYNETSIHRTPLAIEAQPSEKYLLIKELPTITKEASTITSFQKDILRELKKLSTFQERITLSLEKISQAVIDPPSSSDSKPLQRQAQKKKSPPHPSPKESPSTNTNWEEVRKKIKAAVKEQGGYAALARLVKCDESAIRKFVQGKRKSLRIGTLDKLRGIINL